MVNNLTPIIQQDTEFLQLVNEIKQILVEHEFMSRWTLIEGYHAAGELISHNKQYDVSSIAKSLGKSTRTIQRCVQFYDKYPDLNKLPEGKNTSWRMIVNKYLPEPKKNDDEPCMHEHIIKICKDCKLQII